MDAATIVPRKRPGRLVALALTATAGLALLPGTPASAGTTDATIANFRFSPNPLSTPVGATVKWTNNDGTSHTVTADDGSFDSGPISPNGTFTQTFGQARTIAYHCDIHPSMHGTLQIGSAATTTTAPPTTTTTAPTTTTTVRVTTTTAAPTTTTAPSPAPGGGATSPTTAPRTTTTKPAATSTTRAATPTTTPQPPATTAPSAVAATGLAA